MLAIVDDMLSAASAVSSTAAVIEVTPGPNAQERAQTALIDAKPGDTVAFGAGRFEFTDGLSLDIDDVTVKGAGPDKTFLDFKGQKGGGDGLLITSDRVVVRDLAVQDTRGDGIKAKGVDLVACLSVNDAFVMEAWGKDRGALGKVVMLADGRMIQFN